MHESFMVNLQYEGAPTEQSRQPIAVDPALLLGIGEGIFDNQKTIGWRILERIFILTDTAAASW